MKIRPLRPGDWDALLPMLHEMGRVDDDARTQIRLCEFADEPAWCLLGCDIEGTLIGYVAAQDYCPHLRAGDAARKARVHDVFVEPAYRRRGVGRGLIDAVTIWARQRGVAFVEWEAGPEVQAFYERLGFTGQPTHQPGARFFELAV